MKTPDADRGTASGAPLLDLLRDAFVARRTGRVNLVGAEVPPLFVLQGELYLGTDDPLAGRLREGAGDAATLEDVRIELADRLDNPEVQAVLDQAEAPATEELAGPLVMAEILPELAVWGRGSGELLEALGGEQVRLASAVGEDLRDRLPDLGAEAEAVLTHLDAPRSIAQLEKLAGLSRQELIWALTRLYALGAIRHAPKGGVVLSPQRGLASLVEEVRERFLDRVETDLLRHPLELSTREHREKLVDLLSTMGGQTHYELLGLDPPAAPEEVAEDFERLARLVHPMHAGRLELAGPEALEMLFDRAVEAYLVLSDPERQRRYHLERDIELYQPERSRTEIEEERKKVARSYYELAQARVRREDFHPAIEMLRHAVVLDPRSEYFELLGDAQAKNPNWLRLAADAYHRALEARPRDVGLRVKLGLVREQMGDLETAERLFREVLELVPQQPEAREGLRRVMGGGEGKAGSGWLRRLWGEE